MHIYLFFVKCIIIFRSSILHTLMYTYIYISYIYIYMSQIILSRGMIRGRGGGVIVLDSCSPLNNNIRRRQILLHEIYRISIEPLIVNRSGLSVDIFTQQNSRTTIYSYPSLREWGVDGICPLFSIATPSSFPSPVNEPVSCFLMTPWTRGPQ